MYHHAVEILGMYVSLNIVCDIDAYMGDSEVAKHKTKRLYIEITWKNFEGYLSRLLDRPALILFNFQTKRRHEQWMVNGIYDRISKGPSRVEYTENNNIKVSEEYIKKGLYHREDGPAIIKYDVKGRVLKKFWYRNGLRHNLKGPAQISYYKNGNMKFKSYWVRGIHSRRNGPAYVMYRKQGKVVAKLWAKNNVFRKPSKFMFLMFPVEYHTALRESNIRIEMINE